MSKVDYKNHFSSIKISLEVQLKSMLLKLFNQVTVLWACQLPINPIKQ